MGRGFESHRGHQKESQMTCNEPFGFFVVSTVGFLSLAKRHKIDDMAARTRCMETLRELFRQYMSLLILEKTKLEQHCIYLDPRISFNEIDRYFFSGCACAYFQIAVDVYTDLRYNEDEWTDAHS